MRALALTALLIASLAAKAEADTLSDFEDARVAYEEQRYDEAATRLERLVGDTTADAVSAAIVLESRKYLAASYLFLGRAFDAQQQFVLLLRQEPTYELDPVRFPRDVITTFESARRQVVQEQRAEAERRETERRRLEAERLVREAEERAARERDATESVVVQNSRALALLPYGVGQFRNGHRAAGRAFAITEALLSASVVTTYLMHFASSYEDAPDDVSAYNQRNERIDLANWISVGALGAVAIAGIIDAQVRYVDSHATTRRRVPTALRSSPTARVGIGLGRLDLRLDF